MYTTSKIIPYEKFSMDSYDRYFKDLRIGFFDIETTGLDPRNSKLILTGLGIPKGDRLEAMQFLAESPEDEKNVLERTVEELSALDAAVTYNGIRFDVPFLQKRCDAAGTDMSKMTAYDLDLYKIISKSSPLRQLLPNLKQTTVEDYAGLWRYRTDTIDGGQSIGLYYDYVAAGDMDARDKVLLHNRDDICQLSRLMKVLAKCDVDKAMFLLGFPAGDMSICKMTLHKNSLIVEGEQKKDPADYEAFDDFGSGMSCEMRKNDRSFKIQIPVITQGKFTVADLRRLGIDSDPFPRTTDDFLILKDEEPVYMNINLLAREAVLTFKSMAD